MSKIGISIKLDVKKLDKARFFAAQSGALYVDITMFLDPDNEGQYGDHGFATQSTSKEEREQGVQMPILGNGKIFYGLQELKGGTQQQQKQQGGFSQQGQQQAPQQQGQQGQQGGYQQQQQQQYQGHGRDDQGFAKQQQAPKVNPQEPGIDFDDDIPF
jgi:single-strand DNA-binding protein